MKEESRMEGDGHGPWQLGVMSKQGARLDLCEFRDAIRNGDKDEDLLDNHLVGMARYPRLVSTIRFTMKPPSTPDLTVVLHLGATGTGKTRAVHDQWVDKRWWRPPIGQQGSHWYDGYNGHTHVLLDDFAGKMPLLDLLEVGSLAAL